MDPCDFQLPMIWERGNYMRKAKEPPQKTTRNNAPELYGKGNNSSFSISQSEKLHNSQGYWIDFRMLFYLCWCETNLKLNAVLVLPNKAYPQDFNTIELFPSKLSVSQIKAQKC